MRKGYKIGLAVFAVLVLVGWLNQDRVKPAPPGQAGLPDSLKSAIHESEAKAKTQTAPVDPWRYEATEDAMGRKRSVATVLSINTVSFPFPYQQIQHGSLIIRKGVQWGTNVILQIEKGQFVCSSSGCEVNVRFDEGPVALYSASGADDHSTTLLFIENAPKFIAQMRKAKIVRVEATFYQSGSKLFEFPVDGFKGV